MMKILILTASLDSGGAETHIFELSRALISRGHELTLASSGGALARRLSCEGARHVSIPLDSKDPVRILISLSRLSSLLKNGKFDIVHLHSRLAALLCKMALPKNDPPTVVSTVHARFRTSPILRRLSYWGEYSAAVSEDLRGYLCEEYSFPRELTCVIPNAIDTEKFSRASKGISKSPPSILFASRLDSDCSLGASLLCRIAPRLASKYAGLTISIAGGGKYLPRIALEAKKANKEAGYSCVRLLGHLDDMPRALNNADVFVGVSRAALEAMSCAVPVVLCGNEGFMGILDSSNVKEAEKTNFCCRGCELPDAISLLSSISALLDMTAAERRSLGEYLCGYVYKNHTLSTLGEITEAFYKNALKKRKQIVLCGYYGFKNLGDDTMLKEAIRELKRRYEGAHISVICHAPSETAKRFGVRTVRRENLPKIFSLIRDADRLVLGGGSILQDSTSMRSLLFYTKLIERAARCGVPVELMSNGLGPLKRKRARRLAARALSLCEKISLRDKEAYSLALALGADRSKLALEDDLTSRTMPCSEDELSKIMNDYSLLGKNFFLVGIKGRTKVAQRRLIEGEIKVQTALGLMPVFVVMHSGEDKKSSKRLAKKYNAPCLEDLDGEKLLALLKRSKLALGNRYHLLYLAKRQGIPIIPFGDDPKILSLK